MEYNWADPRKNSRVTAYMMAKAEASRVKRLTTVKSTLSNQLHPATQHKLLQKPKHHDKRRSQQDDDDGSSLSARPSSRLHRRDADDAFDNNQKRSGEGNSRDSRGAASNNATHSSSSFYNEFLPMTGKNLHQSIFDEFDVHAAADGLFHPASSIQAFQEHDARYPSHELSDDGRDSGERGNAVLPQLTDDPRRSVTRSSLASRSDSRLQTLSDKSARSGLSAIRSEGELPAPRRAEIVPSSADRSALDFLDDDDDDYVIHDNKELPTRCTTSSGTTRRRAGTSHTSGSRGKLGTSSSLRKEETPTPSNGLPTIDLSLTQKFEQLKLMIQTNRSVKEGTESKQDESKESRPEVDDPLPVQAAPRDSRVRNSNAPPVITRVKKSIKLSTKSRRDAKDKVASAPIPEPVLPQPRMAPSDVTVKPTKIRNGVSLADLKEEHRAALAILEELGGPIMSRKREPRLKNSKGHSKEPIDDTPSETSQRSGSASSRVVGRLRSAALSGREGLGTAEPDSKALASAALDAARHALADCATPEQENDTSDPQDSVWDRYAEDPVELSASDGEKSSNEDPATADSGDLYADEAFERD